MTQTSSLDEKLGPPLLIINGEEQLPRATRIELVGATGTSIACEHDASNPKEPRKIVTISGGHSAADLAAARIWEVGRGHWQYDTIAEAIAAINALDGEDVEASDAPPSVNNRAKVRIYPGYYVMTEQIDVPEFVSIGGVEGGRGTVQLFNSTTNMFRATGDNVWFHDLLIEGSSNAALYAFNGNNRSRLHFERVDMLDNAGTARQRYLLQDGATWTVLKMSDCTIDYNGLSAYAVKVSNSSASARIVDMWVEKCFVDSFSLTDFGGGFELAKLRDVRFWGNVIRGVNTNTAGNFHHTGIRVNNGGSTGITCEIGAGHYGTGVEGGSGGRACFGEANTTIVLGGDVARGALSSGTLTNLGNFTYVVQ